MANIKDLIQSIESGDSSFDEKLAAINAMEETLVAMRAQEQEAIDDNVSLIVEAIKVMERKVEAQLEVAKAIVPEKGDKGERGRDGQNGRDGLNGKDGLNGQNGKDGQDGADGVSVTDAKIDFDGSLVIVLSTGREINVGEVVAPDLAEKIKLVTSGGGTSQQVLDTLASLQTQINTLIPSQTGNAGKYLTTDGTNTSWAAAASAITVQDEGSTLTTSLTSLNFTGSGVTATNTGGAVTVDITGGGGAGVYTSYSANATLTPGTNALANTSSAGFTLTLPATPAAGDQILIVDSAGTFGTNNLIVGRNGSTISGIADDLALDISGIAVTLVYNGSTWVVSAQIGANTGVAVTLDGVQTLTNKTLTAPVIATISNTGTLTLPTSTDTLVGRATTDTLTNKTLTTPALNNPTVTDYVESVVAIGTVTTASTLSLTSGTVQTATLTASTACTFTMPAATAGKSFILLLKQAAATGNGTATFTGVKWGTAGAPTITATAGRMDVLSFVADGSNWYGSITQGFTP
jgi:hypothetical protein